jgi:ubiquinone biosynthesis protein COQ4
MESFARPLQFRTAFRALGALLTNPDDTKQAFTIIEALSGPTGEKMFQRFKKSDVGARVLREKRALLDSLKDTALLESLPENTLGRAYLQFLRSQQITADGLVNASEDGYDRADLDDERMLFSDRMRDMHDLWHVVSGYRGDLIGEASVLALSYAQTKNPGVGLIAAMGFVQTGGFPGARKTIKSGYVRGKRAAWLPAVDWEAMLVLPLDEVRRQLGFDEPPAYEPIYTSDPRAKEALEKRLARVAA